jgi:DNA-binding response OmpR family regulator
MRPVTVSSFLGLTIAFSRHIMKPATRELLNQVFGKRIVIVHTEPMPSKTVKQLFEAYSHAYYVNSGHEGLQAIERELPDIVLVDAMLPDMSCADFVRAVRKNPNAASVLIVAMSKKPHERSDCLAAGCDNFILKPFGSRRLLERLSNTDRRAPASALLL